MDLRARDIDTDICQGPLVSFAILRREHWFLILDLYPVSDISNIHTNIDQKSTGISSSFAKEATSGHSS